MFALQNYAIGIAVVVTDFELLDERTVEKQKKPHPCEMASRFRKSSRQFSQVNRAVAVGAIDVNRAQSAI